ncbi:hypothetical protein AC578_10028 [Pseudocercospora eumusae]|uniref:Uncharacterized protein n=1 Tax=Pseudocercospora eumusae TaxID=321146 RepID=A0A139H6N2_9PEZI|nr:hypothetical protein AC578_10028 [Pseudocercospora eumusae]
MDRWPQDGSLQFAVRQSQRSGTTHSQSQHLEHHNLLTIKINKNEPAIRTATIMSLPNYIMAPLNQIQQTLLNLPHLANPFLRTLDSLILYIIPTPWLYNKFQLLRTSHHLPLLHGPTKVCGTCSRACPHHLFAGPQGKNCSRCRRATKWKIRRRKDGALKAWVEVYLLPIGLVGVVMALLLFGAWGWMATDGASTREMQQQPVTSQPMRVHRQTTEVEYVAYETSISGGRAHIGSRTHTVTKTLM